MFHLYFRACELQETLSHVPRFGNFSKLEMIKKCYNSLLYNDLSEIKFYLIEDNLSKDTIEYLSKQRSFEQIVSIPPHTKENPLHFIKFADFLLAQAQKHPDDIHYLCNDDFLHAPSALNYMLSAYNDGWQGFVLAYDYPDRYTLDNSRLCEVFAGSACHWRTVPSCTGVTSAKGSLWLKNADILRQAAQFNSDSFTWEAYAKYKAICPIPGVATHLTEFHMSPYRDWKGLWESIDV